MPNITQTNGGFVTSYKTEAAAQVVADTINDPEMKAAVVQRRDGRFVIEIRDEAGNRVMVL